MHTRHVVIRAILTAIIAALCAAPLFAQANGAPPFTRKLSTDRPNRTENPYTVEPGHLQIEADLVNWSRDRERAVVSETWSIIPTNVRFGLTKRTDIQFIAEPFTGTRIRNTGGVSSSSGIGTLTTRLKINVWGNDGGRSAFGVISFVTATPSAPSGAYEGGIALPLDLAVSHGWDLGAMVKADAVAPEGSTRYQGVLATSLCASHGITTRTAFYSEIYREESPRQLVSTFDAGITFGLRPNVQFDIGVNVGLSRASVGVNPVTGFSARF
ncbi:MAG TPA: transporter [Gemmatimonadaceae bacterium]|nr:transporter [Gemmatimonadaceae bacterium]